MKNEKWFFLLIFQKMLNCDFSYTIGKRNAERNICFRAAIKNYLNFQKKKLRRICRIVLKIWEFRSIWKRRRKRRRKNRNDVLHYQTKSLDSSFHLWSLSMRKIVYFSSSFLDFAVFPNFPIFLGVFPFLRYFRN